jgi:hypothetical protein
MDNPEKLATFGTQDTHTHTKKKKKKKKQKKKDEQHGPQEKPRVYLGAREG